MTSLDGGRSLLKHNQREHLAALLGIQSFLVYVQLDTVLDKMHKLSSRFEAGRSDAIAYARSESWYCRLSRSILYKPGSSGKA